MILKALLYMVTPKTIIINPTRRTGVEILCHFSHCNAMLMAQIKIMRAASIVARDAEDRVADMLRPA